MQSMSMGPGPHTARSFTMAKPFPVWDPVKSNEIIHQVECRCVACCVLLVEGHANL